MGDIADFEDSVSPQAINRDGQSRYMSVTAEIASGYNIGLVSQDVQKILDKYTIPEGYTVEMKGEDERPWGSSFRCWRWRLCSCT